MSRKAELIKHLPEYLQLVREFRYLSDAESPEFSDFNAAQQRQFQNRFILKCDEQGISVYEKMLDIKSQPGEVLAFRIERVLLRWNDRLPYTYRVLLKMLDDLCGPGQYEITPEFEIYRIQVETWLKGRGQVDELERLLDEVPPANLLISSMNRVDFDAAVPLHMAAPLSYMSRIDITNLHTAGAAATLRTAAAVFAAGITAISNLAYTESTAVVYVGSSIRGGAITT